MPINKFTTLLDLARQAKIISGETATFDGKIQAGIPFSGYPTGVDTGTTVSLGIVSSEDAVFSGNTGTTIFDVSNTGSTNYSPIFSGYTASTWTNPLFSGNTSGLTLPITPLSADTQIVGPFWTLTQTGMTGDYVIGTQYTGYSVTYSFFNVSQFGTGFTYSGFTTASQENFSAGTLDYKGPLDYISTKEDASVEGRLTTNKITITNGASASTIGYVLTQTGENGEAEWVINASADTNTYVTGGTLTGTDLTLDWNTGGSANPIDLSSLEFTGNTSGDCINDIFVSNIHSCSPLNINPLDEGNVYFGATSGLTIDVANSRLGIGTTTPDRRLVVSGDYATFYVDTDRQDPLSLTQPGERVLFVGNPSGSTRISIGTETNVGVAIGQIGSLATNPNLGIFGNPYDSFIYSNSNANNLNIITSNGSGKEDHIRFYAKLLGNVSANTSSLHIQGSGSTKGYVGINNDNPTERLEVSGNTKISGSLNIGTILSGTPLINLGLDSSGNVVSASTGMTDSYTTSASLSGTVVSFDNNIQGQNLYSVDLSGLTIGASFGNTYFVAPNGNDLTGVRGDILKPFQTISGARNVAVDEITGGTVTGTTLIYVFPGTYTDEEMQYENGNFYFSPGARVEGIVRSNSGGTVSAMFYVGGTPIHNPQYTATTCNVFGEGDFYLPESEDGDWNGSIFSISASGTGYFECHEFIVEQGVGVGVLDYGQATFKGAFLGVEKSGYVATVRDSSNTVFDFQRIYNNGIGWPFLIRHGNQTGFFGSCVINSGRIDASSGWQAVSTLRMREGSTLIMNSPIIKSADNYTLNIQQGTGGYAQINGNLYGNKALISNSNTGGVLEINGNSETVSTAIEMNSGNNINYKVNFNGDINILSGTTQAILFNDGILRLNGAIYNEDISGTGTTYNGINMTGVGKLIIDTCKIITDNECITATSAKDIKVIHSLASNQIVNANITNLITGSNIIIDNDVE